jgi:hypothetical protein
MTNSFPPAVTCSRVASSSLTAVLSMRLMLTATLRHDYLPNGRDFVSRGLFAR